MSENKKEKRKKDILQLKEGYESLFQSWSEKEESTRRRIDLTRGVALGLVYGIIGNLFVQFFYPVVEALLLEEYPKSFWGNVIVSGFSLAVILCVTVEFHRELNEDERKMGLATESMKREKYEIKKLKELLDEISEEE